MNIEAYNSDSLRKIVRRLEEENKNLKEKLRQANIPYEEENPFDDFDGSDQYDPDQGGRIDHSVYINEDIARRFFSMFWGREDVYARRGKNGGYFPQCANRWNSSICPKQHGEKCSCDQCDNNQWVRLDPRKIIGHLLGYKEDGSDVIGVYPLFPDNTCRFIVFDFDHHEIGDGDDRLDDEWKDEVNALRKICERNHISHLVERSRSGNGAHIWILFQKPIPASKAREFGFLLLEKGFDEINIKSFQYYDRMYPCQDTTSRLGNLVALPLQGQALKNGNSAFVDEDWNAYPNQWDVLYQTKKITSEEIDGYISSWKLELSVYDQKRLFYLDSNRPKPWKKEQHFHSEDVNGKMHLVLSNGCYVDTLNLQPRIQNQIRSMATIDNPEFYKNQRLGYSNYKTLRTVYLAKDENGYIKLPRGLREKILEECAHAGIQYEIKDERQVGHPIRVSFQGSLRMGQDLAAERLTSNTDGILDAATAFGKTAVCSYLIAEHKVNTLILLQSTSLINQWIDELNKFLKIDEVPPEYMTPKGKVKTRSSVIGLLQGGKNTLTGIIDIAMIESAYKKGKFINEINDYGMVIMDESHHSASATALQVLQKVDAKYVYGVSATQKRSDKLDPIIPMLFGPVRHRYTALERARDNGIKHYFVPRYTPVVSTFDSKENINKAYNLIVESKVRNEMIVDDVKKNIELGRTPIILTRHKSHAKDLYDCLKNCADHVFLLYGDHTTKENNEIRRQIDTVSPDESFILVATGQKVGEGFNVPRLDVLMLAAPVSFEGRLEQYIGRIDRLYEGKSEVYVYDYVDAHIPVFDNMYSKRLKTYKHTGFQLLQQTTYEKQRINAIFDSGNYMEKFEQDLIEANHSIIISSPEIRQNKVERLINIMKTRLEAGVSLTVITTVPDQVMYADPIMLMQLIYKMKENGITVIEKEEINERYAVIDDELVWHGGVNLLGKEDIHDNLMRIENHEVASELLELSLSNTNKS